MLFLLFCHDLKCLVLDYAGTDGRRKCRVLSAETGGYLTFLWRTVVACSGTPDGHVGGTPSPGECQTIRVRMQSISSSARTAIRDIRYRSSDAGGFEVLRELEGHLVQDRWTLNKVSQCRFTGFRPPFWPHLKEITS